MAETVIRRKYKKTGVGGCGLLWGEVGNAGWLDYNKEDGKRARLMERCISPGRQFLSNFFQKNRIYLSISHRQNDHYLGRKNAQHFPLDFSYNNLQYRIFNLNNMAKIDTNAHRGSNRQTPGTMSKQQIERHKLGIFANIGDGDTSYRRVYRHNRKAKAIFQMVKSYRQFVHKSNEGRLPSSLRLAVHYLLEPMARTYGGAAHQDREGNDPRLVPLKV